MIEDHWHCTTCRSVCDVGVQLCATCSKQWPCSMCGKPSAFSNGDTMLCADHKTTKPICVLAAEQAATAVAPKEDQ